MIMLTGFAESTVLQGRQGSVYGVGEAENAAGDTSLAPKIQVNRWCRLY